MAREKVDNKLNVVIGTKAPIVDVTLLEISENELQYYRSKLGKELT